MAHDQNAPDSVPGPVSQSITVINDIRAHGNSIAFTRANLVFQDGILVKVEWLPTAQTRVEAVAAGPA